MFQAHNQESETVTTSGECVAGHRVNLLIWYPYVADSLCFYNNACLLNRADEAEGHTHKTNAFYFIWLLMGTEIGWQPFHVHVHTC